MCTADDGPDHLTPRLAIPELGSTVGTPNVHDTLQCEMWEPAAVGIVEAHGQVRKCVRARARPDVCVRRHRSHADDSHGWHQSYSRSGSSLCALRCRRAGTAGTAGTDLLAAGAARAQTRPAHKGAA